jgi:hypothetical protein
MKAFRSRQEMLDAHELMFGDAGRQCAEIVLRWAGQLFAVPLDALNIRIVLAPVEMGPYNRHAGYHYGPEEGAFILGNRHVVALDGGTLALAHGGAENFLRGVEDFIVHELTHARQRQLLRQHGWEMKRGSHRDLGWYSAVAEACPRYLGAEMPRSSWPTGPRTRAGTLTEVNLTHWPESLRWLVAEQDPRLPLTQQHAHQQMCNPIPELRVGF